MDENNPNFIETVERYVKHKTCRIQILTYFDDFNCKECSEFASCARYGEINALQGEIILR